MEHNTKRLTFIGRNVYGMLSSYIQVYDEKEKQTI